MFKSGFKLMVKKLLMYGLLKAVENCKGAKLRLFRQNYLLGTL